MKSKYTLKNINRAIDLIARYGSSRSYEKVNQNLREFRKELDGRRKMLDELYRVHNEIDRVIPNRAALNAWKIQCTIKRDITRYEKDSAEWVRSLKFTHGMIGNYFSCMQHMLVCDTKNPDRHPLYMAGVETAEWYAMPGARVNTMSAFHDDSEGKVLVPFMNYADNFLARHPVLYMNKHALYEHVPVHAMVYTGRFHRHYPIVLMLRLVVDFYGQLKVLDGDGISWMPEKWIPMLVKMPAKYIEKSNN